MKKILGIILIGILTSCNNPESLSNGKSKSLEIIDVQEYYFPFREIPTIYEYDVLNEGPYNSITKEKSYIKFGFINDSTSVYFLSSYDNNKSLTDSITLIKKPDGFHLKSYSFLNENNGRTIAEDTGGKVFPFSRTLNDNNVLQLNYRTPVMNETADGKIATSLSFKGLSKTPNNSSDKKDCIKFTSKMKASLKSIETSNQMEFEESSTIYDKKNLGLYQIATKKVDGSVKTKTFSKTVEPSDW